VPRIRTWHRVSHDFTNDPEVWELRRKFGDWMALVWLRMLALTDRRGGKLKGNVEDIAYELAANSGWMYRGRAANRVRTALEWMKDKEWIVIEQTHIQVVKHPDYRESWERIKIPQGILIESGKKRQEEKDSSLNGFYSLWSLHPGPKGSKKNALKEYKAHRPPDEAIESLRMQVAYKDQCDKSGKWCAELPHLERWIKQKRWEDEIPELPKPLSQRLWEEGSKEETET